MIYQGVRRCDLCSSEILGRGGADVCYLCWLIAAGDPDIVGEGNLEPQRSLSVVQGRSRFQRDAGIRPTASAKPTLRVVGVQASSAKTSMPRATQ